MLHCTDGGYAKDYTLSASQLTYMFFKYMQGFSLLLLLDWKYQFFLQCCIAWGFLNWEPELCHNLQNLLNLQKFPWYTVCTISYFNSLTPKILIEILLTVCHTILVMLVWRIWYWINLLSPN